MLKEILKNDIYYYNCELATLIHYTSELKEEIFKNIKIEYKEIYNTKEKILNLFSEKNIKFINDINLFDLKKYNYDSFILNFLDDLNTIEMIYDNIKGINNKKKFLKIIFNNFKYYSVTDINKFFYKFILPELNKKIVVNNSTLFIKEILYFILKSNFSGIIYTMCRQLKWDKKFNDKIHQVKLLFEIINDNLFLEKIINLYQSSTLNYVSIYFTKNEYEDFINTNKNNIIEIQLDFIFNNYFRLRTKKLLINNKVIDGFKKNNLNNSTGIFPVKIGNIYSLRRLLEIGKNNGHTYLEKIIADITL